MYLSQNHRTAFYYLGSSAFTLIVLAGLFVAVLWYYFEMLGGIWVLTLALAIALINLVIAVITRPVFRRDIPLLAFHICLCCILVLVAIGQLTYFHGRIELARGESLHRNVLNADAGPLHGEPLKDTSFVNEGFSVDYLPGLRRNRTVNKVSWADASGVRQEMLIGDNVPLILNSYRFYTTSNKGFSLMLTWYPNIGDPVSGFVNLPSYPLRQHEQGLSWQIPDSQIEVWTKLVLDEPVIYEDKPFILKQVEKHHLVIRIGDERFELLPGEVLTMPEGVLGYEELRLWMGYEIYYDWTRAWVLAACLLAVVTIAFSFYTRISKEPLPE
jgi:cytochrome c biogenesis protein